MNLGRISPLAEDTEMGPVIRKTGKTKAVHPKATVNLVHVHVQ